MAGESRPPAVPPNRTDLSTASSRGNDVRTFFFGYLIFITAGLITCVTLGALHR
jgi:hypothetical protein